MIAYLLIIILGNNGVTSQVIPQSDLIECRINADKIAQNLSAVKNYDDKPNNISISCIGGI